ncbi:hypothetical protein [Pedobacter sp. UYP1]|uniref:hypothetical protein n=1 Tax=Pedobacter sp. UYP1 TaxID=1756396 RepID=UPI00339225B8
MKKQYTQKLISFLLITLAFSTFISCKKNENIRIQKPDITKTNESSELFIQFSKSEEYTNYSKEIFGELLVNNVSYIEEDGKKTIFIPIKDQYLNNKFYKRGLVSYYDETLNDFKTTIVEISVSVSELNRIQSLNTDDNANLTGSMKMYSSSGSIYTSAEYKNGLRINESINSTNIAKRASLNDIKRQGVAKSKYVLFNKNSSQNNSVSSVVSPPVVDPAALYSMDWFKCMTKFFGSHAGTATNVLLAGSAVGCVACGGAGAVIVGVVAIGCIPSLARFDQMLINKAADPGDIILVPADPLP